jgi:hypothetical protein
MRLTTLFVLGIAAAFPLFSQDPAGGKPQFEVASIKPNNSGSGSSRSGIRNGGHFFATNVSLKALIMQAYRMQEFQIVGGPNWINTERFDIEARAEAGTVQLPTGPPDLDRPDTKSPFGVLVIDRVQRPLEN